MLEVLPEVETEVQEFLSSQPVKMFVGGEWTDSESGKTFATRDPGEGKERDGGQGRRTGEPEVLQRDDDGVEAEGHQADQRQQGEAGKDRDPGQDGQGN